MKKLIMTLLLISNLAYAKNESPNNPIHLIPTAVAVAGPSEVSVRVKGMVCAFCAQGIEKKFLAQKEVAKVFVTLEDKIVKLTLKDGQTLSKEKISEILKESGYEAIFEK